MTFKQAYDGWSSVQDHCTMYFSTRDVFKKLFKRLGEEIYCRDCDLPTIADAMGRLDLTDRDKNSPASVIVHVLEYAHQKYPKDNPSPDFTYDEIVNFAKAEESARSKTELPPPDVSSATEAPQPEARKKYSQHPVVQISPETLKPIRTFDSLKEVFTELGVKNLPRAIENRSLAGGFYWCDKGGEANFKPGARRRKESKRRQKAPKPETKENVSPLAVKPADTLRLFDDNELIAEMRRRGWQGNIVLTVNVQL